MKCNKCNHILPDDSEFCQYCGSKIIKNSATETPKMSFDSAETISGEDALNLVAAVQAQTTKEAYEANSKKQPDYEGDFDFGLVPEKPIYTLASKSVDGEIAYLSKLRTLKGEKVKWNRRGSTFVDGINGMVDIYDIYLLSGQKYTTVYINMYGAKASYKVPAVFKAQGAGSVDKVKQNKKPILDIINIIVLILPCALSIAEIYCYWSDLLAITLCGGIITIVLKILNVSKFKKNIVINIVISCLLFIMLIPLPEGGDELMLLLIFISTVYVLICELSKLIKVCVEKYHTTQSYKMKCYKKINLIYEYREKGVITEEEFEETRKQIVSKIR